jgi:hypothetical protein
MPLSPPATRTHLHNRDIALRGYLREDGLVDIEAHLTDTRAQRKLRRDGSVREAGEAVHDMWLRLTITQGREIVDCEAAMDTTPYSVCPQVAPNYARLVGLRIEGGFIRKAMEQLGGAQGCTHLRELLQQMGTTAFQTLYAVGAMRDDPGSLEGKRPPLLNTCYAWGETSGMIAAQFPAWYTGKDKPVERALGNTPLAAG